ncbi:hypothetical protein M422DRAFT_239094 [Sphaerobolus stellatus SS14]|nr:hypothetical protein M422DRAFT_239094 [Sphaerobolus stellatus SS14]
MGIDKLGEMVGDGCKAAAATIKDTAEHVVEDVKETAREVVHEVESRARDVVQAVDVVQKNPELEALLASSREVFRVDCDTPSLPLRPPWPKAAAACRSRVPTLPLRSLVAPNAAGDPQGELRLHFNPSAPLSRPPARDFAATYYFHLRVPPARPLAAPKAAGSTQVSRFGFDLLPLSMEQLWVALSRIVESTPLPNPSLNTTTPANTTLSSDWLPFLNDISRATALNVTSLPEPIKHILQDLKPIITPAEITLVNAASYMNIMGVAGILFIRGLSLNLEKETNLSIGTSFARYSCIGHEAVLIQFSAKTRDLKNSNSARYYLFIHLKPLTSPPHSGHLALGLSNVYSRHFWYHNPSNSGTGYTRETMDCISTDNYKRNAETGNDIYWRMWSRTLLAVNIARCVVATQLSRYPELGEYETVVDHTIHLVTSRVALSARTILLQIPHRTSQIQRKSAVYLSFRPMGLSEIQSIVDNILLEFSANPHEKKDEDMELSDLIGPAERNDAI